MKNNALSLFVVVFFLIFSAQAKPSALSELQAYTNKEIEKTAKISEEALDKKNHEMLRTIENTVKSIVTKKEKITPTLLKELVRVASLVSKNDPSQAASELLLPLYKTEKKSLEQAIDSLPKEEAADLRESIQQAAREEIEGNG